MSVFFVVVIRVLIAAVVFGVVLVDDFVKIFYDVAVSKVLWLFLLLFFVVAYDIVYNAVVIMLVLLQFFFLMCC